MTSDGQSAPQAEPLLLGAPEYPAEVFHVLGDHAPSCCYTLGHRQALAQPLLALFCSERCPGDLIIKACDVATALRDAAVPVISGFHSPVERECLRILLSGTQPVVICPARSLERMRLRSEWLGAVEEGRLLLMSPFGPKQNRPTAALAAQRNEFVAVLARAVLIIYADAGGFVESVAKKALDWRKPLFALESPANGKLFAAGGRPLPPESPERLAAILGSRLGRTPEAE